jgi:hypothetical protein
MSPGVLVRGQHRLEVSIPLPNQSGGFEACGVVVGLWYIDADVLVEYAEVEVFGRNVTSR